ncbi:MAG: beta-lactamase family protein, partial [Treponema sp.]|nr:beta-lactamase family protein [Treponema sp.]
MILSSSVSNEINSLISIQMQKHNIPGVSIVISNNDKVLFSNSYGFSNLKTNKKMNNETLVYIASSTKA